MRKRFLNGLFAGLLAITAIGGEAVFAKTATFTSSKASSATEAESTTEEESALAEDEELTSEADTEEITSHIGNGDTIRVAASATPHAEILEAAKPILEEYGWNLEITIFDDYILPNEVVESGEFDANYFQHIPYLNSFNEERGTHLVDAGDIHYEPFGIYPGKKESLDDLEKGDVIAVPNDTTNEARALLLLQDNGIITLKKDAGLEATVNDITENPYDIDIEELKAEQVARVAEEVAFVVLNGNYALQAGYSVAEDSIAYEKSDSEAAKTYVNLIAVKEGHENDEGILALTDVLKSDEIKDFIQDTYEGSVIPFED